MISVALAKNLKDAGLSWEPAVGDRIGTISSYQGEAAEITDVVASAGGPFSMMGHIQGLRNIYPKDSVYWLPPLESLIAEVDKFGVSWEISPGTFSLVQRMGAFKVPLKTFSSESVEQAVAEGLLWLMQQKQV